MDDVLRHGLLEGRTVVVAAPEGGAGAAAADECTRLGANVIAVPEGADVVDAVVIEPAAPAGEDADAQLISELGAAWDVVYAAANAALIPQERGKIVLIGPRQGGGAQAEALRDGLENMARTLSIEWARHGILPTMIAPGASTADGEVATLVAFLVSPAGDYYSGCRFELGSV